MKRKLPAILVITASIVMGLPITKAARFAATGQLGPSTISLTGFSGLSFIPTWTFNFDTDGQSITFNEFRINYTGKIYLPQHHAVFIDMTLQGAHPITTRDINPVSGNERWQALAIQLNDPHITGVYHSFDFSQPIDATPHLSTGTQVFDPLLDFTNYPNSLLIGNDSTDSIVFSSLNIPLEPSLSITALSLQMDGFILASIAPAAAICPCCGCADFNDNSVADGADYVVWRKSLGQSVAPMTGADGDGNGMIDADDFSLWRTHFAETAGNSAAGTPVPEPTAFLMLTTIAMNVLALRHCKTASQDRV